MQNKQSKPRMRMQNKQAIQFASSRKCRTHKMQTLPFQKTQQNKEEKKHNEKKGSWIT